MKQISNDIPQLTDHLFRYESGKMIAVLTKIFGTQNLQLAEDVVQETFISALNAWKLKGIPDNPSAWLMRSAKNKAIDVIRKNKFSVQFDFNDSERELLKSEYTLATKMDTLFSEAAIQDDLLKMMFACCHESIAAESQITLMLKTLCGFSTAEIAKAFLTSEDTVSKRLYRTKEFFREKKIKPEFPATEQLKNKTQSVLKTIYLIFNEGYNSTHSNELIRKDLLEQAMYLCSLLCNNQYTQLPQVYAAMALMCFHAARINSRINPEGEIILLAEQDRKKWDAALIQQGNYYMNKAAHGTELSSYHVEAAIAYEHCIAPAYEKTNWQQILSYYNLLVQFFPTSMVMLNRLMVVYKIYGSKKTLEELNQSPYIKEWQKNYLYHSLLGKMYSKDDKQKAKVSFEKAIQLTKNEAEKKLLQKKIDNL